MSTENLVLGAGCFWGVEHHFSGIEGVLSAEVGYAGGITDNPSYEEICRKDTMHAEVVNIVFNSAEISRESLLQDFFMMHNPTTLNRQGPDVGTQYRSVIFYSNEHEKNIALKAMQKAQENYVSPIVTTLEPTATFWRAEEYHQQYFKKRGMETGCH